MSAFKKVKTTCTDLDALVVALEETKPDWAGKMLIDHSGQLVPLGYQADDRTKIQGEYHSDHAYIIVPGTGSQSVGRGDNVV